MVVAGPAAELLHELRAIAEAGVVRVAGADGARPGAEDLAGAVLTLGALAGVAVVRTGGRELATVMRPDDILPVGEALAAQVVAGHDPVIGIEVRTTLRNAALAAEVRPKGPWAVEHPSAPHGLPGPVRLLIQE